MTSFKDKGKESLEKIVKYAPMAAVTALEVPLHEGLHAATAKIMPHVACTGIVLNNNTWYAPIFKYITLGFYKTAGFPANIGGYAEIAKVNDFLGNLGQAVVSAAPEMATMTLGLYWIKKGIENISEKGRRIHSMASAYCGTMLTASAVSYMAGSALSPGQASDYTGFTQGLLGMLHLPSALASPLTFLGSAAMFTGSLYLAKTLSSSKSKAGKHSSARYDIDLPNIPSI